MTTIVTKTPKITFLNREQSFRFNLSGLLPLTVHNMYFERIKVNATNIKPLGGSLGDTLKSDENGKLVFDFFYTSNLPAAETGIEQAQNQAAMVSGNKEVIVASLSSDTFPTNTKGILSYYKTLIGFSVFIPPLDSFVEVESARPITTSTVGSSKV